MSDRTKAFFINGGAGRVLCSIPAFEKYYEETSKDFIIVCEGGTELYKGHPILDARAYDIWHKNLFQEKLKDMDIVTPEPYRVWEYYNQQASLAQAFDIEINNKGLRELPTPTLKLSRAEKLQGLTVIKEVKEKLKKDKVVVFQPFGRGIHHHEGAPYDPSGRSFDYGNVVSTIKKLQNKNYGVILFSEVGIDTKKANLAEEIAHPHNVNLRIWAAIIQAADLFLGCDSVGQHMAHMLNTPCVAVLGSTFPVNVSYPESDIFKVIDLGMEDRQYSPIRITQDEYVDRNNESLMLMTPEIEDYVLEECKKVVKHASE